MYAIREMQTVRNGQVTIQIPADFPADQVEVIILPAPSLPAQSFLSPSIQWPVNGGKTIQPQPDDVELQAIQNILTMDTSQLTSAQMIAYQRTASLLREWLQTQNTPPPGLFAGLVEVADDFDAPLPDDIVDLFYGSETDEYGISLPR